MAEVSPPQYDKCIICVDNQSSIQAIDQSAQYIIQHILESFEEIQRPRLSLKFIIEWVPGHIGIDGNEKADKEAKKATLKKTMGEQSLPQHHS